MSTVDLYASVRIRDALPRGAGALVSKIVHGKATDGNFDLEDIKTVRGMLDDPAALEKAGVSQHIVEYLPAQLDALEAYIEKAGHTFLVEDRKAPFARAFKPSALFSDELRTCAEAVAHLHEGSDSVLTLGEFLKAKRFWEHEAEGTRPKPGKDMSASEADALEKAYDRFLEATKSGVITRPLFDLIHQVFQDEGVARAQTTHGPLHVGERVFTNVFRLDTEGVDVSAMSIDQAKAYILHRYEADGKSLHENFYDRVYVQHEGHLYLLLDDGKSVMHGKHKVSDEAVVATKADGRDKGAGRVVHRQPGVNSLWDASKKVYTDMKGLITGDGPLKQLLEADKRVKNTDDDKGGKTNTLLKLLVAATVSAPLLAALKAWGVVGIGALGIIATGRNVKDYVQAATDSFKLKAAYNAIGFALGVDGL